MHNPRQQHPDDHRRMVVFFVLAAIIMGLSYMFITRPAVEQARQQQLRNAPAESVAAAVPAAPQGGSGDLLDLAEALATSDGGKAQRITLDSDLLHGSVPVTGLRFDDIVLKTYYTTLAKDEPVRLLAPDDTRQSYFVEIGLMPADPSVTVPDQHTQWRIVSGGKLTPDTPVILEWNNGKGLVFRRMITMDHRYLVSVNQQVENKGTEKVTLYPYARIVQSVFPLEKGEKEAFEDQASAIMHLGPIAYLNEKLHEEDYSEMQDLDDNVLDFGKSKGWLGITSKYWHVSLLPEKEAVFDARFVYRKGDHHQNIYQVDLRGEALVVLPSTTESAAMRFFAGAKKLDILQDYEDQLGVPRLDLAIDFGVLYFLTKPLYVVLSYLGAFFQKEFGMVVSFGMALLVMTVLLRGLTFPLQNKAYRSMNRMKDLAPKIQALKEKHGDNKEKFQQEVMGLYKNEKVNPASGCLPILLQIPIFFALYKVIFITLDMRHAPFWGWVQDLSAPDPTNLFNLFGLLSFDPPALLTLGAWPILYGITMWMQQRLNPQPEDETQKMVFGMMPWLFMLIFARFPAGLVIYYTWSNILGVVQQYSLRRMNPDIAPPPSKPRAKKARKSKAAKGKSA